METLFTLIFVYTLLVLFVMALVVGVFIATVFITFALILIGTIVEVFGIIYNKRSYQKLGIKIKTYGFNVVDFMLNKLEI